MRVLLRDLTPGTEYAIQLRTNSGDSVSEWSRLFPIPTMTDNVSPDIPAWITPHADAWKADADTFVAQWTGLNMSLPQNIDFSHYELKVSNGTIDHIIKTTNTAHVLTFDQNRSIFGDPEPTVSADIRAVDQSGNASDWAGELSATNPVPGPPTSPVVGDLIIEEIAGLTLNWDEPTGPTDNDIIRYRVYVGTSAGFTPGPSNIVYSGAVTGFRYSTSTGVEHFFKIRSVDKFDQESTDLLASGTPIDPFSGDATPPDVPTDLAGTITNNASGVGARVELTWTVASPPSDLAGFYIRFRKSGDTNWSNATFQSDERAGIIELQSAYVNYQFQIKAFDWSNNESAWSGTVTVTSPSNTVPSDVGGLTSEPGVDSIRYAWTASTDADLKNYEVTFSTSPTFASGNITFLTGTSNTLTVSGLDSATTYYTRVRAIDVQGSTSAAWSSTNTTATLTVTDGMITSISASKITTGTLDSDTGVINIAAGASLVLNGGYIKSNTYTGTSYDAGATAGFYVGNDGVVIADGAVSADAFVGGTFNAGTITIGAGGSIDAGTWTISDSGIDIPDGAITASKLTVQLGRNLLPVAYSDFETNTTNINSLFTTDFAVLTSETPGKFNTNALKATWTTTGVEIADVRFTHDDAVYNVPVTAGSTYIISGYFWSTSATAPTINLQVVRNDNDTATTVDTEALATGGGPTTAVRLSGTYTVPAGVTHLRVRVTSPTTGTNISWSADGLQVEEKTSSTSTPSPWSPGSATYISGGQIRTGSIQSTNYVAEDTATPMWSIDLDGDAIFSNLKVLGASIMGKDAADSDSLLQSSNYQAGAEGWQIRGDGVAEFQQIIAGSMNPNVLGGGRLGEDDDGNLYTIELKGTLEARSEDGTRRVGMNADGFYSYGPDGSGVETPFVLFPTTGAAPNIISGELHAQILSVSGAATFSNGTTFLPDSTIILSENTATPEDAPSVTADYPALGLDVVAGRSYNGFTIGHNGNYFATAQFNRTFSTAQKHGTETVFQVREFNATTGALVGSDDELLTVEVYSVYDAGVNVFTYTDGAAYVHGITWVPDFISAGTGAYLVAYSYDRVAEFTGIGGDGPDSAIRIAAFNTSFALLDDEEAFSPSGVRTNVSIGRDFVNTRALLSWRDSGNNSFRVTSYNWSGGALAVVGTTNFSTALLGSSSYLVGMGPFDFGANRYVWADNSSTFKTIATSDTTTVISTESFNRAGGVSVKGAIWNTTNSQFESMTNTYKRHKYMGNSNTWSTGGATANWNFKYTLWDSTGTNYETAASPASVTLAMPKRARLRVSHTDIPFSSGATATPNRSRIYRSVAGGAYDYVGFVEQPGQTWALEGTTISVSGAIGSGGTTFPPADSPAFISGNGLYIGGEGLVKSKNPFMKKVSTASQNIATATWTAVTLPLVAGDAGSRGDITSGTNTITIEQTGLYYVMGKIRHDNTAGQTTGRRLVRVEHTDAAVGSGTSVCEGEFMGSSALFLTPTCTTVAYLTAGDTIRLASWQNSTVTIQMDAGSELVVAMIP